MHLKPFSLCHRVTQSLFLALSKCNFFSFDSSDCIKRTNENEVDIYLTQTAVIKQVAKRRTTNEFAIKTYTTYAPAQLMKVVNQRRDKRTHKYEYETEEEENHTHTHAHFLFTTSS